LEYSQSKMNSDELCASILFSLCYAHLLKVNNLIQTHRFTTFKEGIEAHLIICNTLFELAAGAAVRYNIRKETTDALVVLMEEIQGKCAAKKMCTNNK
jgi:hypothetical protein